MGARREPTAAEGAASEWIVRLDSPDATFDDYRRFQRWLRADPGNQAAYDAVARTWRRLDAAWSMRSHAPPPRGHQSWRAPLAAAALAALALIAVLVSVNIAQFTPVIEAAYATRAGEQRSIALLDGTRIELDAATEIRVAFTPTERRVALNSGTALFDVRRDPNRPFVVRTESGSIRVLGTSFVVRVSEGGVRATVLRGVVQGEPRPRWDIVSIVERSIAGGVTTVTAHANEEFSIGSSDVVVAPASDRVIARRLAWREGMLDFADESLRDAAADVTRHTGVAFEFADPRLGDTRITAYISAKDANNFATHLQTALDIEAERIAPDRIRLSERPSRKR